MVKPACVLATIFAFGSFTPTFGSEYLHTGECVLGEDPLHNPPPLINFCFNASTNSWSAQKSKSENAEQPPVMHRADGKISMLITPWVGIHASGHSSVFIDRQTNRTANKENRQDNLNIQFGNNALSRHRLNFGRGKALFRLNHNQRANLEYIWDLDKFEAPHSEYTSYTYDNQLDGTFQFTYGRLTEAELRNDQRLFASAHAMYDIAALEGTRISIGGYNDGLVRRAGSLGLLNINGKGDQTSLEIVRTFSFNPYKPSEFRQLIRLSYISHAQEKFRYKFQYDDFFQFMRLGGIAAVYEPYKYTHFELLAGFAKREDRPKLSHWFAAVDAGVHLE